MYEQALIQAGLSKEQASIYEILVKNGPQLARDIHQKAAFSRPLVYKVLDELIALGLADKDDKPGKISIFSAAHPLKLKEIAAKALETARDAETAAEGVIGKLTSDFNLQSGKPGVRFFEGLAGVKAVLEDSLTAQTEIYSYADLESIEKHIAKENREYVEARERAGIKKKGLVHDTPFARTFLKGYAPGVTETKLIPYEAQPFHTVMQIYDGKISYITLSDESIIGVIIADQNIYSMHRDVFLHLWHLTPEFDPSVPAPSQTPQSNGRSAEGTA